MKVAEHGGVGGSFWRERDLQRRWVEIKAHLAAWPSLAYFKASSYHFFFKKL